MKLEIIVDIVGVCRRKKKQRNDNQMTLEGSIKFHNFESNRTSSGKKLKKIKIYISMIKEIYGFL